MTPKSINITVAEKVKALGSDAVVNKVVDSLANAEVTRRADALAAAIKLSEDLSREIRKASKPDQVSIATSGEKTETFSAKAFEAKKKIEERAAKLDKTVENAITTGEWGKLYEVVKSGGASAENKADESEANS